MSSVTDTIKPDISTALAVEAIGLTKQYENGRISALDGLDLSVRAGEFLAVCGPSGCGKSTLLNMLAGIDRPDQGTLEVGGKTLATLDDEELDEFRAQTVGLVFQLHNLLPNLTAIENVQIPMLVTAAPPQERRERSAMLLERVGLTGREHSMPATLSGGERQRVAIARALSNQPEILLADEPTGALDSKNGERLLELLEAIRSEFRTTLIVVTHDEHLAERAERVVHMLDGRVRSDQDG
jgi:putative ABC transport system ATP-binding protein